MSRRMTFQEAATLVKHSLDIVDVVGRYVSLKRAGRNYTGLCPFHQEKTPSFNVNREKQMFKCFGCGEGGDTLTFLMKRENKTYGELITELAEDQGIEIIQEGRRQQAGKGEQDLFLQLHELAQSYYQEQLKRSEPIQAYLAERQIPLTWQAYFGLGYAPAGWENLVQHLKQQVTIVQQTPALLEKAGLANIRHEGSGHYDRFRNRLIIPILDDRGRIVAFGGRCLTPEDTPKYLNSPETPIYVKSRILYGLSQGKEAIRTARYAILMEGYFDVISAHMAGLPQAVGVCGTSLTENHLKLLQRAGAETLYLCFDSDEAGQTAALRAIELVETQLLDQGIQLKVISLPGEKDPDDFLKTQGKERFLECLENAQDFLTFKFAKALAKVENLHSSEGRIQAVQLIGPILAQIAQPIIRQEHIKQLAEQLQIAEETLLLEVKRLEKRYSTYPNKKNYESGAISFFPERYIGGKRWNKSQARRRPEDITVFRKHLSEKIPIEDKEHLLMSYLFLNDESYTLAMDSLQQLNLQSSLASGLLKAIAEVKGQWNTLNELIDQLSAHLHATEQHELLPFLAHRVMTAEAIQERYQDLNKGLKSVNPRETLKRDIEDMVNTLQFHRKRAALSTMAQDARHLEQQADDRSALEIQLQLREALKARRNQTREESQSVSLDNRIPLEEEQGV